MYESGKSRADLWAFAAIVAVEFGVETNNGVCDDSLDFLNAGGAGPNVDTTTLSEGWLAGFIQCSEDKGQADCKMNFPRSFKFQTGRKDCTEFGEKPYIGKSIHVYNINVILKKGSINIILIFILISFTTARKLVIFCFQ